MARFGKLSGDQIEKLVDDKDSINTQLAVKQSVRTFRDFLVECKLSANFEDYSVEELCTQLAAFWPNARTKKGELYKKKTLQKLKFGLKKHILKKCNVDIDKGDFRRSSEVFLASLTDLKKKGKGSVVHKLVISVEDLAKLYSGSNHAFNVDTPAGLFYKTWFEVMFFFCRRGQENLRNMTKRTYSVKSDGQGMRYISQYVDEMDKNHGAEDDGRV